MLAALACALSVPSARAQMRSVELPSGICKTTGGGKFVRIPGFPGEKIDRRLLPDVEWMVEEYAAFITDGYSMDPVHTAQGEHPIGLAVDIVPDKANGGSWRQVDALAAFAEPKSNRPIAPFRWVGYDGDSGHGRGNHLHISWSHSDAKPGTPARVVYTMICPGGGDGISEINPGPPSGGTGSGSPGSGGGISPD